MTKFNKALLGEFLGTLFLVLFGSAVALQGFDLLYVALGFGGTLALMAFIFGGHFNPAVSVGAYFAKKLSLKDLGFYTISQFLGAFTAVLLLIAVFGQDSGLAANIVSTTLPGDGGIMALFVGLLIEIVLTFVFVLNILNVTSKKEHASIAPLIVGFGLFVLIIVGGNLTGTSVNPVRSLAPALFNSAALEQVWLYILGPTIGGLLAGLSINKIQ